jgi:PPOX class probable F420-dependent enzyme
VQLDAVLLTHVLEVWPVGRLATLDADGSPHVVPIVFAAVDGCIWSPIDGKPKRAGTLQRIYNVARTPSVSLLLDRYDADWTALWWIRIDGSAEVVSADPQKNPASQRIAAALRAKYPQYRSVDLFSGTPTLLRIRPERHAAWSAQPVAWETLR